LELLHAGEDQLRAKAIELVAADEKLMLHLDVSERAMDVLDCFRQMPTEDEDLKVIQVLGMRQFNALAASIKLMFSGYTQISAMIMRDILETVFLVDLFNRDKPAITRWRSATKKERLQEFRPVKVREFLDDQDGFTNKRRAALYDMFSELAGHPGIAMLRPKNIDARSGPFLDPSALEAALSELGWLAIQVGMNVDPFFLADWSQADAARLAFAQKKAEWLSRFYGPEIDRLAPK
jgi:hypothetical protein